MQLSAIDITLSGLKRHYAASNLTPRKLMEMITESANTNKTNPVWIRRLSLDELEPYLRAIEQKSPEDLPLYGIPFAIKDNIDLANIPTTAGCAAFCYTPTESATAVKLLIAAGALPVGKTNLDQFATGLVGTRSPEPWGACQNALNPEIISGGSSSGSAVAVASGWATFALGTDTAGSGRVPAALNNIIGLKPTRGLVSTKGVVPACRSLDCVSIFALTADDANSVFDVIARYDDSDSYSRRNSFANGHRYLSAQTGGRDESFRFAVPQADQLEFFGDKFAAKAFSDSVALLENLGGIKMDLDFSCFLKAAKLLYEGPWVAERYLAIKDIIDQKPEALLAVTRKIIAEGKEKSAAEAFSAHYQLQEYFRQSRVLLRQAAVMVTPTIGTACTIQEVVKHPVWLNSNLGYYTNFMNLLDLSAISVPASKLPNKAGFGITLFAEAMQDKTLLNFARRIQQISGLPLGALPLWYRNNPPATTMAQYDRVEIVVCGAHMEGLPLNWQLQERGGVLVKKTNTSKAYRLYALAGGPPFRPGLLRDPGKGSAIDVEVWRIPAGNLGSFVNEIPPPLGIGKIELADGKWVSGFICEPYGLQGAEDITHLLGWWAYTQKQAGQ